MATNTYAITSDATLVLPKSLTRTSDALLIGGKQVYLTSDAALVRIATLSSDAFLLASKVITTTSDAALMRIVGNLVTSDAALMRIVGELMTSDAVLVAPNSFTRTSDALLSAPRALTGTSDALLAFVGSTVLAGDAFLVSIAPPSCTQTFTLTIKFSDTTYLVTPDIFSGSYSYFNPGFTFPPGVYKVSYVSGAVGYGASGTGAWWLNWVDRVTLWGAASAGYQIIYNGGSTTVFFPGTNAVYPSIGDVETANNGISFLITHSGGPIGMRLWEYFQSLPYTNNSATSAPTFSLIRIS